jgi:hypothetical protein
MARSKKLIEQRIIKTKRSLGALGPETTIRNYELSKEIKKQRRKKT